MSNSKACPFLAELALGTLDFDGRKATDRVELAIFQKDNVISAATEELKAWNPGDGESALQQEKDETLSACFLTNDICRSPRVVKLTAQP